MPAQLKRHRHSALPSAPQLKAAFSAKLNTLLNEAGLPEKQKGRQAAARDYLRPVVGDLKITDKAVRKWLVGQALPELDKLLLIAIHFDVNLDWLLTDRGDRSVKRSTSEAHRKVIEAYEKLDSVMRGVVDKALGLD